MSPEQIETTRARRNLIRIVPSRVTSHDYLIDLSIRLTRDTISAPMTLIIRYVPDRDLIDDDAMHEYWRFIEAAAWSCASDMALAILEDLNNELIPRWVQVQLRNESKADYLQGMMITVEDRQPGWHNQYLLSRIGQVEF